MKTLETMENADHIIDLGLDGGEKGGDLIFQWNTKRTDKRKRNQDSQKYLKNKTTF